MKKQEIKHLLQKCDSSLSIDKSKDPKYKIKLEKSFEVLSEVCERLNNIVTPDVGY